MLRQFWTIWAVLAASHFRPDLRAKSLLLKLPDENRRVEARIEDNGTGIPANLRERVFERFFRVDEAHSTRGSGLGLPIAKLIVENFGGTIDLESEVVKGTTVTITLGIKTNQLH
jgi:signal transduction histidine kinase